MCGIKNFSSSLVIWFFRMNNISSSFNSSRAKFCSVFFLFIASIPLLHFLLVNAICFIWLWGQRFLLNIVPFPLIQVSSDVDHYSDGLLLDDVSFCHPFLYIIRCSFFFGIHQIHVSSQINFYFLFFIVLAQPFTISENIFFLSHCT